MRGNHGIRLNFTQQPTQSMARPRQPFGTNIWKHDLRGNILQRFEQSSFPVQSGVPQDTFPVELFSHGLGSNSNRSCFVTKGNSPGLGRPVTTTQLVPAQNSVKWPCERAVQHDVWVQRRKSPAVIIGNIRSKHMHLIPSFRQRIGKIDPTQGLGRRARQEFVCDQQQLHSEFLPEVSRGGSSEKPAFSAETNKRRLISSTLLRALTKRSFSACKASSRRFLSA